MLCITCKENIFLFLEWNDVTGFTTESPFSSEIFAIQYKICQITLFSHNTGPYELNSLILINLTIKNASFSLQAGRSVTKILSAGNYLEGRRIPENVKPTANHIESNRHIQSFHNNPRWSVTKSQFVTLCDDSSFLALFAGKIITCANRNSKVSAGFQLYRSFNRKTHSHTNEYTWLLVTRPLHVYQGTRQAVPFKAGYFYHTPKRGRPKGHTRRYYQNRLAIACMQLGIKTIFPFGRGHTAGNYRKDSVNFPFTKLPRNFPKVEVRVSIPLSPQLVPLGEAEVVTNRQQHQAACNQQVPKELNKHQLEQLSSKRKRWIYWWWFNRDTGR